MKNILIKDVHYINRGKIEYGDIFIRRGRIERIGGIIRRSAGIILHGKGLYAMPGIIDDQVHFREPGLTHKADIYTESRAAVAGGVTSYMEMPNTKPPTLTQELLEGKYQIAAARSLANYSFYMGASNDNLGDVLQTSPHDVCGVKVFMGSSTGNMLVDDPRVLENLFARCETLIATHCEDETIIRQNERNYRSLFGDDVPFSAHPDIRNVECCLRSSSFAVELAKKYTTRLHVLHITTADELSLFTNQLPLEQKHITSEVCVHHLWFSADDYQKHGAFIKCNPAIKRPSHRKALWEALLDDRLDVIATDHAPHTSEEKSNSYFFAPSGLPLIQHPLNIMLEFYHMGKISLEHIVEKMCHAPARCFRLQERGFLDEGCKADVVLFDPRITWQVTKENIFYKCKWSPFEQYHFRGKLISTIVNGHLAYHEGRFYEDNKGERLTFDPQRV